MHKISEEVRKAVEEVERQRSPEQKQRDEAYSAALKEGPVSIWETMPPMISTRSIKTAKSQKQEP
ncbi:MAG: hypothetical protein M0Z75_08610 [Nitrospiraceae bacterium]|nr:hypothetical protein [Nitrospiraceae bacterium]